MDISYEYGYLLGKVEQNSLRADGKYSQITMVLPEKNAVVYKICFLQPFIPLSLHEMCFVISAWGINGVRERILPLLYSFADDTSTFCKRRQLW